MLLPFFLSSSLTLTLQAQRNVGTCPSPSLLVLRASLIFSSIDDEEDSALACPTLPGQRERSNSLISSCGATKDWWERLGLSLQEEERNTPNDGLGNMRVLLYKTNDDTNTSARSCNVNFS